ncbi:hypothetical protein GGF32_004960 [Allomyces javanicus]|nr:hypothetical protein GGF32_004960 [Allomyces javanicus]
MWIQLLVLAVLFLAYHSNQTVTIATFRSYWAARAHDLAADADTPAARRLARSFARARTPRFEIQDWVFFSLALLDNGDVYLAILGTWVPVVTGQDDEGQAGDSDDLDGSSTRKHRSSSRSASRTRSASRSGRSASRKRGMGGGSRSGTPVPAVPDAHDAAGWAVAAAARDEAVDDKAEDFMARANIARRDKRFTDAALLATAAAQEYMRLASTELAFAYDASRAFEQAAMYWKHPHVADLDLARRALEGALEVVDQVERMVTSRGDALPTWVQPRQVKLHEALADIFFAQGRFDEAANHWDAARIVSTDLAAAENDGDDQAAYRPWALAAKSADARARAGEYRAAEGLWLDLVHHAQRVPQDWAFRAGDFALAYIVCALVTGDVPSVGAGVQMMDRLCPPWEPSRERRFLLSLDELLALRAFDKMDALFAKWNAMLEGWRLGTLRAWVHAQDGAGMLPSTSVAVASE